MRRRRLLQALSTASLWVPWLPAAAQDEDAADEQERAAGARNTADVIVIGAGMAGIACARELRQVGYQVIVLEARERIGGRILTDRTQFGVPVDLGAAWIHGVIGNPLTRMVADAGIRTAPTEWEWLAIYAQQKRLSSAEFEAVQALHLKVQARLDLLRAGATADLAIDGFLAQAETALLDGVDPKLAQAVRWLDWCELSLEYAIEPNQLSASAWNEDEEFDGDHVLLREGYGTLVEQLAAALDIRRGQVVSAIEHGDDGALVRTRAGAVFESDALVCTLPLGVLKEGDVRFDPPLPAAHRGAIARLRMGTLDKVVLRYPKAFWPVDQHILGRGDAPDDARCEFYNLMPLHDQPVLVALTAGRFSLALERMAQGQAVSRVHGELQAMFGNAIPAPLAGYRTNWVSDPFARGSYSAVAAGSGLEDFERLGAAAGACLFLAGEATAPDYPGTVHGAWLSGVRAAGQVAELLE